MTLTAFLSATLALLIAPGPTNMLMGLAGAQSGLARVARLIPAELAGYLAAILPLALIGGQMIEQSPGLSVALKALAAVWVMILAVRLWRQVPGEGQGAPVGVVSGRTVLITTFLNPKALIFGLVLLPAPSSADFLPRLGLFCLSVVGVALLWGTGGGLTRMGPAGASRLAIVRRVAALWLALLSAILASAVLRV